MMLSCFFLWRGATTFVFSFCCHLSFCFSVVVVVLFYSSYIHFDICCLEIDVVVVVVVYVLQSSLLCFIVFIVVVVVIFRTVDRLIELVR